VAGGGRGSSAGGVEGGGVGVAGGGESGGGGVGGGCGEVPPPGSPEAIRSCNR